MIGTAGGEEQNRVGEIIRASIFGPVPVGEDGGPPFAADWEARVYALATVLRRRGLFRHEYGTSTLRGHFAVASGREGTAV